MTTRLRSCRSWRSLLLLLLRISQVASVGAHSAQLSCFFLTFLGRRHVYVMFFCGHMLAAAAAASAAFARSRIAQERRAASP